MAWWHLHFWRASPYREASRPMKIWHDWGSKSRLVPALPLRTVVPRFNSNFIRILFQFYIHRSGLHSDDQELRKKLSVRDLPAEITTVWFMGLTKAKNFQFGIVFTLMIEFPVRKSG